MGLRLQSVEILPCCFRHHSLTIFIVLLLHVVATFHGLTLVGGVDPPSHLLVQNADSSIPTPITASDLLDSYEAQQVPPPAPRDSKINNTLNTRGLSAEGIKLHKRHHLGYFPSPLHKVSSSPPDQPLGWFSCIGDHLLIPFSAVNDDYCDCSDGSDEPGTSACAGQIFGDTISKGIGLRLHFNFYYDNGDGKEEKNQRGQSHGANPPSDIRAQNESLQDHSLLGYRLKFYCKNEGSFPLEIYPAFINDRVCDCCDGSDEWETAACPDRCEADAKEWREAQLSANRALREGLVARQQGIERGKTWIQQSASKLLRMKENVARLKREEEILQSRLNRSVKAAPSNINAGITTTTTSIVPSAVSQGESPSGEQLSEKTDFPEDTVSEFAKWAMRDGIDRVGQELSRSSVHDEEDEDSETKDIMSGRVTGGQSTSYEGSKKPLEDRSDTGYYHVEYALAMLTSYVRQGIETSFSFLSNYLPPVSKYDSADISKDYARFANPSSPEVRTSEANGQAASPWTLLMSTVVDWGARLTAGCFYVTKLTVNGAIQLYELAAPPDSQAVIADLQDLRKKIQKQQRQIEQLELTRQFYFGPQMEFFILLNQCVKTEFDGYTYEICFFGEAKQMESHGVHSLGKFSSLSLEPIVDDLFLNFPEEEKVTSANSIPFPPEAYIMRFTKGGRCSDSVHRELTVKFICGSSTPEIVQVREPSRCRYFAVLKSAGACEDPTEKAGLRKSDTELNKHEPQEL